MDGGGGESDGMGWGVCSLDVKKGIFGIESCKCREGCLPYVGGARAS